MVGLNNIFGLVYYCGVDKVKIWHINLFFSMSNGLLIFLTHVITVYPRRILFMKRILYRVHFDFELCCIRALIS